MRATLLYAFPNDLRNVFLSADGPKARVWVEPKHALNEKKSKESSRRLETISRYWVSNCTSSLRLVTKTYRATSRAFEFLKGDRPGGSFDELKVELAKSFTIPSEDWLKRRLDVLYRTGKVVWIAGGSYACLRLTPCEVSAQLAGRIARTSGVFLHWLAVAVKLRSAGVSGAGVYHAHLPRPRIEGGLRTGWGSFESPASSQAALRKLCFAK